MKKLSLALTAALTFSGVAYAGITVTPLNVNIQPGASSSSNFSNVTITNDDNTTPAYVKVIVSKILNPGTANEKSIVYQSGDNPSSFGLLVSPQKFVVQPNGTIGVRITNLVPKPTTDAYYSVLFTPVSGPNATIKQTTQSGASIDMSITVSFAVKVHVMPAGQTMSLNSNS